MGDDGGATDPRARGRLALEGQLRAWRAALDSGATRDGRKVGLNIAEVEEVMGGEPVFGYLTSATRLEPGDTFSARGVRALRAGRGRRRAWQGRGTDRRPGGCARRDRGSRPGPSAAP